MDETAANELVERAKASPQAAFVELEDALNSLDDAPAVRSILLRGIGDAARWVSTIEQSIAYLRESIDCAERADRADLGGEARVTLAGSFYIGGHSAAALATLDDAAATASDALAPRVEFQRATILAREGQLETAIVAFDRALPRFQAAGDLRFIAATYGNRGMAKLERGDTRGAHADLEQAVSGFLAANNPASAAWMQHNLGKLSGRRGDVVAALRYFRDGETALTALGIDSREVQVNRCEVLLGAGLYVEAAETATRSAELLHERGLGIDKAEAGVARSLALLGQLRYEEAATSAAQAAELFREQARTAWAARAEVVALGASASAGQAIDVERTVALANELEGLGQELQAARAWAVVSRVDAARALAALRRLQPRPQALPFEYQLIHCEVHARERVAAGDLAAALRITRAAADLGRRHQLLLSSADLRAAVSAQLEAITQLGLAIRLQLDDPWAVLRWIDRSRSASTGLGAGTVAPAQPEGANETAELLAELRAVQHDARNSTDEESPRLLRRQALLQRKLVTAHRLDAGHHHRHDPPLPPALQAQLAAVTVVQYHQQQGNLGAVVVDRGQARVVALGPLAPVMRVQAQLMRSLRQLAGGRESAVDAVGRHARELDRLLLPATSDAPLVVVPTGGLSSVPWSLLPSRQSAPTTVAPTLRHWLRGRSDAPRGRVGLAGGADLVTSAAELAGIAAQWVAATQVEPQQPPGTVADVVTLLGHSDVVHLTCHGDRRTRDGRFAQLCLIDGNLTGLDLERLPQAPALVVLAACDAGLLEPLPGDEAAGLGAALFSVGTRTIVAPVTVLADSHGTAQLFIDLHRHLAAGLRPSAALFRVQQAAAAGPERLLAQTVSSFGCG